MLREKSILFRPIKIGNIIIPNRFMRSATCEKRADDNGMPQPELLKMIKDLAFGEVGLIVPGYVYINEKCRSSKGQTGMSNNKHSNAWKSTIDQIHNESSSKIIFQLCHGGAKSLEELTHFPPEAPSPLHSNVHEMTEKDIKNTINSFIQAAERSKEAGADGVQIHCAHGFLLSEFLSPTLNLRHDEYGGSAENRIRIVKEIAMGIRKSTGPDFLLSIKINGEDYDDAGVGVTSPLCAWYISQLMSIIDLFEISAGIGPRLFGTRLNFDKQLYERLIRPKSASAEIIQNAEKACMDVPYYEGYNVDSVNTIRRIVPKAKLSVVGGLRSFDALEHLVTNGTADLVSLSRPFIRQPNLVKTLRTTSEDSQCISCGLCMFGNKAVTCYYP